MTTDAQLRDQAVALLQKTTDPYPTWVRKGRPASSDWAKAFTLLSQIGVSPPMSTNPVPPPAKGAYLGAYIDGSTLDFYYPPGPWSGAPLVDSGTQDGWAKFEQDAGKKVAMLMFGAGGHSCLLDSFSTLQPYLDATVARVAIPVVDMQTFDASQPGGYALNADIANGKYDTNIKAFAAAAAKWGKPWVQRLDCEMNGTWYGYGAQAAKDPATFVAAWRHIHDLYIAADATNVAWHWCPNYDPDGTHTNLASLYPGSAYVDWTGFQLYNSGNQPFEWGALGVGDKLNTYQTIVDLDPTKPLMIGEVGSVDVGYPGQKVTFIQTMFTDLPTKLPQVKAFCWFNWRINEGSGWWDWPIESSAASLAAFKTAVASGYIIGR